MILTPQPLGESENYRPLSRSFTLTTWNVWFDKRDRASRNENLLSLLGENPPDICCFQEVTPPFVRALQACPWMKQGYWISATHHQEIGVVMVSRLQVHKVYFSPLTSNMGRRLLVAEFGNGLSIASAHFESSGSNAEIRRQQFEESLAALSAASSHVLAGDFNCSPETPESSAFESAVTDLWTKLRPQEEGFTYDSVRNTAAAVGKRTEVRTRIDRVLVGGNLDASSIELLGTESPEGQIHCSDHFGLRANLALA